MKLTVGLIAATLLAMPAASAVAASPESQRTQTAFLHHEGHAGAHAHHHRGGCFVTTSAHHHTKQVRHWRNPCPHHERKHLNPYHAPHHRPHRPHPARHF